MITEPAEADLHEIADYIAVELKEPSAAQHLMAKLAEAILELEQMPLRYALVSDERLAYQGIRKLVVENYLVFYVVSEKNKVVTIIRVLSGKREWNSLL
jgi:addiction module RelE/StbE family toxin